MSRLSKNIIYNFAGQTMLLLLGLVTIKFIFKQLGGDALGIIYFTFMLNTLLCIVFEVGINSTTVREISSHFNDEPEYINDLLRTASMFYWSTYLFVGIGIYFTAPVLVAKWINLDSIAPDTAVHVIRVLGISAFAALPKSFYSSVFQGLQRMEFNNSIDVVTTAAQQLGAIMVLYAGGGLFHVVYWYALWYALRTLVYIVALRRFLSLRSLMPGFYKYVLKRNIHFISRLIMVTFGRLIFTQVDKVIISKLLPVALTGFYGVAFNMVHKGSMVSNAISNAVYPSFSQLFKNNDRKGLMTQYVKYQDLVCYITVPVFASIFFFQLPVFAYIFDTSVALMLFTPTTLLSLGFYMLSTLTIPHILVLAMGKPEIQARTNIYALIIVLPVTVALIYTFGLTGAGLSVVFNRLFVYSYAVPRVCRECLNIPVIKWYSHVSKIFILALFTYGLAWFALGFMGGKTILNLSLAYICASILFMAGAFSLIGKELRQSVYHHMGSLGLFKLKSGRSQGD